MKKFVRVACLKSARRRPPVRIYPNHAKRHETDSDPRRADRGTYRHSARSAPAPACRTWRANRLAPSRAEHCLASLGARACPDGTSSLPARLSEVMSVSAITPLACPPATTPNSDSVGTCNPLVARSSLLSIHNIRPTNPDSLVLAHTSD